MRTMFMPLISLLLFSACSNEDNEPAAKPVETVNPVASSPAKTLAPRGSAYLRLGDKKYELDVVFCTGTTMATAVASDSQKRPDHPVITIRTYDDSMTGGVDTNTASAVFDDGTSRQHWKRYQGGNVSRREKTFSANGFLEGSRMIEQAGGTLKSAPLEENGIRAFDMHIKCRG